MSSHLYPFLSLKKIDFVDNSFLSENTYRMSIYKICMVLCYFIIIKFTDYHNIPNQYISEVSGENAHNYLKSNKINTSSLLLNLTKIDFFYIN